jgi:hypothetical protein
MKFIDILLFLRANFALVDPGPDPGIPLNPDPDTDSDPQLWYTRADLIRDFQHNYPIFD